MPNPASDSFWIFYLAGSEIEKCKKSSMYLINLRNKPSLSFLVKISGQVGQSSNQK
jgi:hypothetical protein